MTDYTIAALFNSYHHRTCYNLSAQLLICCKLGLSGEYNECCASYSLRHALFPRSLVAKAHWRIYRPFRLAQPAEE